MARLFNFLNKIKKESPIPLRQSLYEINIVPHPRGLNIQVKLAVTDGLVKLPIDMPINEIGQQNNVDLVELINDLWLDELLEEESESSSYVLLYEHFEFIPIENSQRLGIPDVTKLDLKLGHIGAVGTRHFKFILEKAYGGWSHLEQTAKQIGPWIILADQTKLLMTPDQFQFEQLISQSIDPLDKDKIFSYVAQVRSKALSQGIQLDEYLELQDYLFVDELELDVEFDSEQAIRLTSQYRSTDLISPSLLAELNLSGSLYKAAPNNQKVFVNPTIVEQVQRIKREPLIKGTDIPRFVENPEAFLPVLPSLDLSLFSERVKSLGIRVYKAQPFVHAKENERGWFEVDYGFSAKDENGEVQYNFQSTELAELIKKAKIQGDDFIEWNGSWLKIPQDAEEFIEKTKQLEERIDTSQLVDVTKLPYILEIFENINHLEFNQPILEAQRDMKDLGVLDRTPPTAFIGSLKPFQEEGFIWMKALLYRRMGGLLADDMGLGKTIQVVSLLTYLMEISLLTPTLIIVPKTLIENWEKEIRKFAPSLLSSIYLHRGLQRIKFAEELKNIGITITTYQTLVRDQLVFGQVDWQAIICDEAQAIKNPSTAASHVVKAMKSRFRLAMTGTPVENGLSELWSIMDYVQPGILGSLQEFKKDFVTKFESDEPQPEAEQQLLARISMVYKRRTKSEELADQLPSKAAIILNVPLGIIQQKLYKEVITLVREKVITGLTAIQKLKALSSHPGLLNNEYLNLPYELVPKLKETIRIIESIREKGEKVLIFTEYIHMQEILRSTVRQCFQINPMIINGMTDRRQDRVDDFNQKIGFDVLILSPKAAGVGLTITSANHVIHYTRWWNPAVESQATDRVYRIGQDKDVTVYYPIVTDGTGATKQGTVEEIVHRILTEKQNLASSIIVSSKKINFEDEVLRGI
jgi:SNF2 family DNA or RNA helicase